MASTNRNRIINATLIVGPLLLLSSILNFVRTLLMGYYFGTDTIEAIALSNVIPLPDLIFILISGGAVGSGFIPVFTKYFIDDENPDLDRASTLFSAILNLIGVAALIVVTLAIALARPLLAAQYADALAVTPELLAPMVRLFRIMLLAQIVFAISGVLLFTLYARQRFLMPAVAVVVYALGQIIGLVILRSPEGVAWGMVFGAVGHLLVQLPVLRQERIVYRPILTLQNSAVRRVLWLTAPRTLGLAFSYLNPVITPFLAQTLVEGSAPALYYANRIMIMPQSFVGRALGVTSFPTFADLAARGETNAMRRVIAETLRLITFVSIPITILLAVLARPLIRFALEYGAFKAQSTDLVSFALIYYSFAILSLSIIEILSRAFYALEDTLTPVAVGFVQLALMITLGWWLGRRLFPTAGLFGVGGIALGYTLSNWVEVVALVYLLRRKLRGLEGGYLLQGALRMTVAGLIMALLLHVGKITLLAGDAPFFTRLPLIALISTLSGCAYLAVCQLLRVEEMTQLTTLIRSRLHR